MDRGAWWAIVHRVTKSRTQLKWLSRSHVNFIQMSQWMVSSHNGVIEVFGIWNINILCIATVHCHCRIAHHCIVALQSLSCVRLFVTPWTAACQAFLAFSICQNLIKFMSIKLVTLYNHLILCSLLPVLTSVFLSIKVFSNESALRIRWPKYWSLSFSTTPSSEYSRLISFKIDLLSTWLSGVFSSTRFWKHQFLSTQPSLWSNSHIHI